MDGSSKQLLNQLLSQYTLQRKQFDEIDIVLDRIEHNISETMELYDEFKRYLFTFKLKDILNLMDMVKDSTKDTFLQHTQDIEIKTEIYSDSKQFSVTYLYKDNNVVDEYSLYCDIHKDTPEKAIVIVQLNGLTIEEYSLSGNFKCLAYGNQSIPSEFDTYIKLFFLNPGERIGMTMMGYYYLANRPNIRLNINMLHLMRIFSGSLHNVATLSIDHIHDLYKDDLSDVFQDITEMDIASD